MRPDRLWLNQDFVSISLSKLHFTAFPFTLVAPRIDRDAFKDITLKAGQKIIYDVPVIGEPAPEITWNIKGKVMPAEGDSHHKIDTEDYNTKLITRNVTRADSGAYTITAINSSGRDTVTVEVVITDKPSPPGGPLEVADVHKEGCKLAWKKPEDDGGCPLEGYLVEKMDTDTGLWVPVGKTKGTGMDVAGLVPGKEYKFRVSAVNKEGESEPLETLKPIVAKNPFDEPGKVDKPEVTDWDKDHVDLKWNPPKEDGGAPITGYIIEKKDKFGDWEKVLEVPGNATDATVKGLQEGQSYQFRVRAVNKAGPGEPSDATDTVIAKPRRLPPKIDRTNLDKIKIKANQSFNFDVNVTGEPAPDTEWTLKDVKQVSKANVKVTHEPYNTKISVRGATRANSGIYKIKAVNKYGEDEAEVEVIVLDKPSPPGGPLKIEDVHAEGATLKWRPPEDDGGLPIDHYVIEKLDPTTGIWVPAAETNGNETSADVKGLTPGHKYKFRVKAVNRQGESEPLTSEKEILAKNPFGMFLIEILNSLKLTIIYLDTPGAPGAPKIDDYDTDFVKLSWDKPKNDGGSPITGYVIEKKDKYNNEWAPCAEVEGDINNARVGDLIEGNQYEFRVRAVNKGGQGEPSDSSGTHIARPKNAPPKIDRAYLRDIKVKAGKTVELDVPISGEPPPTKKWSLEGVTVSSDDRWTITGEDYKTHLVIKNVERKDSGKLVLTANNINGTDTASITLTVLDVPGAPENMRISDITKDGALVSWSPPKDDGGSDISHYVVEKKDMETGRWIMAGESATPACRVEKLIEGHEYMFRVKAVNKEGDSPYLTCKDSIVAKNPFDVASKPQAPAVVDYDADHVDLEIKPPRNDGGAPITEYIIEKKPKNSPFWKEAIRIPAPKKKGGEDAEDSGKLKVTVPDLVEGEEYEFRVVAVNKAGPSEPSDASESVTCKPRRVAPTIDVDAMKDIKVRAGRPIGFTVPIKGEPTPAISWSINGKVVLPDDTRVETTSTSGTAIINIPSSVRGDSGTFKLTLRNPYGEVSASATVTVQDKPSPPEGPLEISEITKESCKLRWKAPKDDGGSPIKHYVLEKMDVTRGSWTECGQSTDLIFKVPKLVHKKQYQFRVSAVNDLGESEPLENSEIITAKNEFDVAEPPGKPNVVDWGADHVDLEWKAPSDNGGSPITGYIIQKKEKNSPFWTKAATVSGNATKATVPDLREGAEYEFRIVAVNKAGESEPSEPSDLVLCKHRNLPPKIITPMKEKRIKHEQKLEVEIEFVGAPPPEVVWTKDGKEIKSDARLTISNYDGKTVLTIVDSKRGDSGDYTLKLTNVNGSDQGVLPIVVLDKPAPPQGPLDVVSVDKDNVELAWRPPKDDGGSPLIGYVIEKRDKTAGGQWVPAVVNVPASATHATVPKLIENHEYEFRIMAENNQGLSEPLKTDKAVKAKAPFTVADRPGQPELVDSDRTFIKIKWDPPRSDGGSPVSGYDVERRDLKSSRWIKVNNWPVTERVYTDDTVTDGHAYEYRVIANNKAGPSEPSLPSKSMVAKPLKEAPKLNLDGLRGKTIRVRAGEPLEISIPMNGAPEPSVEWLINKQPLKPTNRILTKTKDEITSLKIPVSQRGDTGTYTIIAKNPYGEDQADIEVLVYNAPSAPRGPLEHSNITSSSVTLDWKKPEDDGGSEIIGYSVEKCFFGSEIWTPAGYSSVCTLTAKNLEENKQYKFRVRAENMFGISEPLESSKWVTAKNSFDTPDAPGQPQVIDYGPTFGTIKWTPPLSDGGRPIQGYIVEKREKGHSDWAPVNASPSQGTEYTVNNLIEGRQYEFRVVAVNEGGKGKPSKPSATMTAKERQFAPDAPDAPRVDKVTKDSVTLTWKKPFNDGGSKITGYIVQKRPKNGKDWENATKYPCSDTKFTVGNLKEGDEYEFRIIAVNDIGESAPSKACPIVRVEEQPNKPHIDVGAIRDITVKAGQDFTIDVPFTGFPRPTATWSINDVDVPEADARFNLPLTDTNAKLVCKNAKREYTGRYNIMLKNPSGFDTVSCNVKVLDRPKPPINFRCEEVDGDTLTLRWSPPRDDGGSEITNYVLEKREQGQSGWSKVSSFVSETVFRVRNLIVGKTYEFRVAAENQYGVSDFTPTDEPITARYPFDVPGAPGTPRAVDTSPESITLTWSRPRNDGGSPITGYVLEKKKVGESSWSRATGALATINETTFKVGNLKPNEEYEFRVAAVNAAGKGAYSETSEVIIARNPPSAPKILGDFRLKDVVVLAGETFNLRVPFSGSPTPHAEWTINDKPAPNDDRVSSEVNAEFTILLNKKAKRDDSGIYTLKLTNSEGSDSASCRVMVVDVPGRPKDLEVTDVTPETCSLSWKPPADDGGSPITNYILEKQDQANKQWIRCSAFIRSGHFEVFGLEPNHLYHFRVKAENQYGVGEPVQTDSPIKASFPFTVPDPPGKPTVVNIINNKVSLTWDRPIRDGGSEILGYSIEFQDPSDGRWLIGSDHLVKGLSYTVTGLIEGKEYRFRVKAKNAAGFSKPGPDTGLINLRGDIGVPSPPRNLHVTKVGRNYVDLKWEPPRSDGDSRITGYLVERKEVNGSHWYKVNEYGALDCSYTVLNLPELSEYEFRVSAVNAAGQSEPTYTSAPVKIQEFAEGSKPEFVRKLFQKNTNLHTEITFECEAIGKPLPNARWFKNGREIVPGFGDGRFKTLETDEGVFKLVIMDVCDGDEGDYVCEAYNSFGTDRTTAPLRLASAPEILRCPHEVFLTQNDTDKVKIFYTGSSPIEVSIFKNGQLLSEDDGHFKYTVFDDYTVFYIRDIRKDDEGSYSIQVKNDSGQAKASFKLTVTGLPDAPTGPLELGEITRNSVTIGWKAPKNDGGKKVTHYIVERKEVTYNNWITVSTTCRDTFLTVQGLNEGGEYLFRVFAANENGQSVKALEGESPVIPKHPFDPPSAPGVPDVTQVGGDFVNLSWAKPESDGGARIQGYYVEKRETGTQHWQRVNVALSHATQINIAHLIEDREYEFRVFAVNEAGTSPPSENTRPIRVKDPDVAVPPEFITPLRQIMAVENRSAEFSCTVIGTPKPTITWYKGVRELFDGGKFSMLRDGDTYILKINNVFGEDADEYYCKAVNKAGTRTSRAELVIKTAPRLYVPPRFRDAACFDRGENVQIKIPFTGNPKPSIKWSKDGEEIEKGDHFDIIVKDRHAILVIRNASQEDNGPYTIVAENELGVDSAVVNVVISDRPDPPRYPIVENVGDENVTISWQAPLWNGGSQITNYVIEKREAGMSSWVKAATTRFLVHQVTNLNPGKEYEFRVFAENVYGRSEPSEKSQKVQTKPGKERVKRTPWEVDDQGRKVRGRGEKQSNYDQFVSDYENTFAQSVEVKSSQTVYDLYDILEEIGVGAFGVVHRCREKKTGRIFAAKFIPVSHPSEKSLIRKEIDIMNQLHHLKLIRLHDAFEEDDEMVLIYEFMSGGELFERITDDNYRMTEEEAANYMRQIIEGIKHMHEKNIIHLDIKPENIMCQKMNSNLVKIIDFGLATKLDPHEVVKISTGTAEFAAPEIVEREAVGFYTDMWACGVLTYVLLSGLTPFAGDNDIETLKNVKACNWEFDQGAFANISDEAKDFIRRLLTKEKEKRMTAHECLDHAWLKKKDEESRSAEISKRKYLDIRDRIRAKYPTWDKALVPIGHIANYSSLRKLHDEKYHLHDYFLDRREALPRFVLKPQSTIAYEGQSAKFFCRVIAAAPPTLSWFRESSELKQSVKFMKRYADSDYTFIINRCRLEDRGEYIIHAENHYGSREEPVFLNVLPLPKDDFKPVEWESSTRRREPLRTYQVDEPRDSAPYFTFLLRTRIIQMGVGVRLLCCLEAKPWPQIKWFKDGRELAKSEYSVTARDGVITLDILACRMEDAGKYSCVASNVHGSAETSCSVIVEPKRTVSPSPRHLSPSSSRLSTPIPGVCSVPSPLDAYYSKGGATTLIREARAHSVLNTRASSVRRDSYSSSTSNYTSSSTSNRYQHQSSYTSHTSSNIRDKYSSARTSSYDGTSNRGSSLSRLTTADTGRVHSPVSPLASYDHKSSRPSALPTSTGRTYGASAAAPSSTGETRRSRKSTGKLDNVFTEPSFSTKLSDQKINDGGQLALSVQVAGDPEPKVEWYKDGRKLVSSDVVDLKYRNGNARLTIEEAFPEDEGKYECVATNSEGKSTTTCFVTIIPMDKGKSKTGASSGPTKAPRITSHLQSVNVNDSQPTTLRCTIKCDSNFDVIWLHNDKEIKKSDDFNYHNQGEDYILDIAEVFPEDAGIYTCEAFNDAGEAFSSCTILVKGMVIG